MIDMKVHVGTRNPLKVRAVRAAFAAVFTGTSLQVSGIAIDTGLLPQPFEEDVARGATLRARRCCTTADFGVGIEAGLVRFPGCERYLSVQFCAIVDREGRMTVGHGPGYEIPPQVLDRLHQGSTLNREMSRLAGVTEIKETSGAIGYLSRGRIDRFAITREAVLMALIPLISELNQ